MIIHDKCSILANFLHVHLNFIYKVLKAFTKNLFFPLSVKTAVKVRAITKIKETQETEKCLRCSQEIVRNGFLRRDTAHVLRRRFENCEAAV